MPDLRIDSFDDLLSAARRQPEPQRLLFVFAGAELPDGSTAEQRRRFEAGAGGALVPLLCVDKTPEELGSFAALVDESRLLGLEWAVVFVASLAGRDRRAPTATRPRRHCAAWSRPSRRALTARSFRSLRMDGRSASSDPVEADRASPRDGDGRLRGGAAQPRRRQDRGVPDPHRNLPGRRRWRRPGRPMG
jgi:hypothetical protein